jgi:hypothetical protein
MTVVQERNNEFKKKRKGCEICEGCNHQNQKRASANTHAAIRASN